MFDRITRTITWVRANPRRTALIGAGVLLALLMAVQLFYPRGYLLPFTAVDGQQFGAVRKKTAIQQLNTAYARSTVNIYYGSRSDAYQTPKLGKIGLKVANDGRFERTYPWYLRLVPTSVFWASKAVSLPGPAYERNDKELQSYVVRELGESCNVAPKNASLKVDGQKLKLLKSSPGGTCSLGDVTTTLATVSPKLPARTKVRVAVDETPADIQDADAVNFGKDIQKRIASGVPLKVNDDTQMIDTKNLYAWMEFGERDKKMAIRFNAEKAKGYFDANVAPKVKREPGVTKVTTVDFQETGRVVGASGQTLDLPITLERVADFAEKRADFAQAVTAPIPAKIEFSRTYSPTDAGLSALIANYAKDNPGKYGISLIELSGKRRRANYNGDQKFTMASTYKLYVAYSTLKRAEDGRFKWDMEVSGGRNLEKCFDDMIVHSDNACAESLVKKISYRSLTDEAVGLGAKNTTFVDPVSYKTTADDLALFVASLESGESLQGSSRAKLLSAMTRNVYRQGIPAGANGQVADKVGFLDDFLHDAAVVYSPSGTYVLSIMTEGSTWGRIANLTKQIEELRSR